MTTSQYQYLREGIKDISDCLKDFKRQFNEHRVVESEILARHDEKIKSHDVWIKWVVRTLSVILLALAIAFIKG